MTGPLSTKIYPTPLPLKSSTGVHKLHQARKKPVRRETLEGEKSFQFVRLYTEELREVGFFLLGGIAPHAVMLRGRRSHPKIGHEGCGTIPTANWLLRGWDIKYTSEVRRKCLFWTKNLNILPKISIKFRASRESINIKTSIPTGQQLSPSDSKILTPEFSWGADFPPIWPTQ